MSRARPPARPHRAVFVLMWLGLGVQAAWLLAGAPPAGWRPVLENLAYLPVFFLGAALAFGAGRQAQNRAAAAWRWMGAGLVSWGSAEVVYLVWDRALHLPTFPSPADAGWLLALGLLAVGLAHLRRKRSERLFTLSFLVDAALVTLIVAHLLWTFAVRATLTGSPGDPFPLAITLAYPAGDLLLCAVLVVLILWQPVDLTRRELALLAVGLFSFLTADVIYAYQSGQGLYQNGTVLDLGWSLAAALIGWAAYQNHRAHLFPGTSRGAPALLQRWAPLLPHYGVLLAFVAYIVPHIRARGLDRVESILLVAVSGLFMLRQVLILTHNQGLYLHLSHRATHDPLTGVRNRADLELRLGRTIDAAWRRGETAAVLFVDLDRMKQVNDTFGHPVGDAVLREMAARLTSLLGPGDDLARFGGDEFVMVLPRVRGPEDAAGAAARIVDLVGQPVQVGPETVSLTGSVGVALVPGDAQDAAGAIERADAAMYQAKHGQRNTWRFVRPDLNDLHAPQVQLETLLRGALERGEFSVVFQPLVTLGPGTVEGFEALLRWHSPVLGPVPPSTFIPVAEAREMMGGIGRWVLREALREARAWRAGPLPGAYVSVNVSATQFAAADFVDDVRAALAGAGVPPIALMLELTESAVTAHPEGDREKLLALRALGVRTALDDFGMGYSSLGHLRRMPVDVLKIDRTFVREVAQEDAAFVRAIVTLGQSLRLRVVAEGIEDETTAELLRGLGCDVGQGYLYARPLPAGEVLRAVEASFPVDAEAAS